MPKYYYTCPIKTLYMMKEFGVKFIVGDQGFYGYEQCLPYTLEHLSNHYTRGKFYVAESSEHIFEPKEEDTGIDFETADGEELFHYFKHNSWNSYGYIDGNNRVKIIMRDNKQFFMPEVEND